MALFKPTTTGPLSGGRNVPCGLTIHGAVPVNANSIVLDPVDAGRALLSRIACRSVPGPESAMLVTVKTAAFDTVTPQVSRRIPKNVDWVRFFILEILFTGHADTQVIHEAMGWVKKGFLVESE